MYERYLMLCNDAYYNHCVSHYWCVDNGENYDDDYNDNDDKDDNDDNEDNDDNDDNDFYPPVASTRN